MLPIKYWDINWFFILNKIDECVFSFILKTTNTDYLNFNIFFCYFPFVSTLSFMVTHIIFLFDVWDVSNIGDACVSYDN